VSFLDFSRSVIVPNKLVTTNTRFHENSSCGSRLPYGRTWRETWTRWEDQIL